MHHRLDAVEHAYALTTVPTPVPTICYTRADLWPSRPASEHTRVLHLIESDGVYGAEQVVLALAREAASDARFPATIGCLVKDVSRPNPLHERAVALGLPAVKLRMRTVESPIDLAQLPFRLRGLRTGIIHAHGYKAAIAGYAAHLVSRAPIVGTCHLWFEESESKWTYKWLTRLERRLYPRFAHVIAVSAPIAAQLRRWHVPDGRLTEIRQRHRARRRAALH